jgi:hypothetical protein
MKHSKLWLTLILIASALLLSAGRNTAAESQSKPHQRHKTHCTAYADSQITKPTITATFQPTAAPSTASGATYIYNQYKQSSSWGNVPTWLEAIATIGLVAFAFWQMHFIRRSTEATENAAKAAADNAVASRSAADATAAYARIAERSLFDIQRPWVLVFSVKWPSGVFPLPADEATEPQAVAIAYSYKNYGATPAWITDAWALFFKTTNLNNLPTEPLYFLTTLPNEIPVAPDSPTAEVNLPLMPNIMLTPDEIRRVERRELFLYAYGIIKYRDIHGRAHETRWGSVYFVPLGLDIFRGMRLNGPPTYNRHT